MKNLFTESFDNKLLKYSLAAGAVLLGAKDANAQLSVTTVNYTINIRGHYNISFNGNRRFKINALGNNNSYNSETILIIPSSGTGTHSAAGTGSWLYTSAGKNPKALTSAYSVTSGKKFANKNNNNNPFGFILKTNGGYATNGNSFINSTKYIGIKFQLTDGTHYGWIKVTISLNRQNITVDSYAYNTTVGAPAALPVELTTFTADNLGDKVELQWNTATEVNNYGFEVQRSEVGNQKSDVSWEKIGFVKGSGNSNSPKSYSFIDLNPLSGKTEYRLKQIDNDGNIKYSQIVTINSLPTKFELMQNYPNPFNPSTNLRYSIPYNSHVRLTVYNILGQRVKVLVDKIQDAGYYKYQWDASDMASGLYISVLNAVSTNGQKNYQSIKKMILLK